MKSRFSLREVCRTTATAFFSCLQRYRWHLQSTSSNSSRFLHERGLVFQWQNGYGAFSVSFAQLDRVTSYIRSQPEHHKKMTFEQEFLALLKKAGVSYDPKYVLG
jgi:putative transposase